MSGRLLTRGIGVTLALALLTGCSGGSSGSSATPEPTATASPSTSAPGAPTTAAPTTSGLPQTLTAALAAIDRSADPCVDFDKFANGAWIAGHPLAADKSGIGTYDRITEAGDRVALSVLDRLARATPAAGSWDAALGTLWRGLDDEAALRKSGVEPLRELFASIDAAANVRDLVRVMGQLTAAGIEAGPHLSIESEATSDRRLWLSFEQESYPSSTRDLLTDTGPSAARVNTAYTDYVAQLLQLSGIEPTAAKAGADLVVALEKQLARATLAENLRPTVYSLQPLASFTSAYQAWHADAFIEGLRLANPPQRLWARDAIFLGQLATILNGTPLPTLRLWLRWRTLNAVRDVLPQVNDAVGPYWQLATGAQREPLRQAHLGAVNYVIRDALGHRVAPEISSDQRRRDATQLGESTRRAASALFNEAPWMSAATRAEAQRKLAALTINVGGVPDDPPIGSLKLSGTNAAADFLAASRWRFDYMASWQQTVRGPIVFREAAGLRHWSPDGYAQSITLSIDLLAGAIAAPNMLDDDPVVAYGGVGTLLGHEMAHHFDSRGRGSDSTGVNRNWWSPPDIAAYDAEANKLVAYYGQIKTASGAPIDGRRTLAENLADVLGLRFAYRAFTDAGLDKRDSVSGFTPTQRFFLGFAWRSQGYSRPEAERIIAGSDVHTPGPYRTNAALAQMPEFAAAFGCKAGSPMVAPPAQLARIW